VAYFTNGVGQARWYPCLMTYLQHRRYGDYQSDFKSQYGQVDGPVAPNEAGGVWGRFFDQEAYTRYDQMTAEQVRGLRNTVYCTQRIFGDAPFVNKNVKHQLRIDALSRVFPNAYFMVIERDLPDVAVSVLRGRYKNLKKPSDWWSVRPPNYEALKDLPAAEQVAGQVIALQAKIQADFAQIAPERVLRANYAEFCREPESLIERLQEAVGPLETRGLPKRSFSLSVNRPETDEEKHLITVLERIS
jgi:hypothetical protein